MNLPLGADERDVLAAIIESHHCSLLHETFRATEAGQPEDAAVVLKERKVLEGIMDKMGLVVRARAA
jgi:hypothetical protein